MTVDTYSKTQIIDDLKAIHQSIRQSVVDMPDDKLFTGSETSWSPADYLKHLIVSVKPFAKGLLLPREQMEGMFGKADGSMTYDDLVVIYQKRIDEGMRAEDAPGVTPMNYRMPEGVDDVRAYLVETWDDANNRLFTALENWSDADLDTYKLPHPAVGTITVREMLFFTVHHNRLHGDDIERGV